ncbi:reverse transcriptase domain-containing protein [Tanacetum coccineum]
MMTQSVGRATATPRGGRIGGRTSRGGGRTRGRSGDQGNGGIDGQGGQVGGQGNQGSNQGNPRNQNDDAVNDNIHGDVRNAIVNKNQRGCTYKKFLACNPKVYDGKGAKEPPTIQKVVQKDGTLTDEAIRNGSLKKNTNKRGNGREPNRDRNARDENKRTRTGNAFATTANPVRREYNGTIPKCVSYNLHHPPKMTYRGCFNCGRPGHMEKNCRVAPRMVNQVNARNPTAALGACFECGGTD